MNSIISLSFLLFSVSAFAAGDGGHGSAADLIAPAFNVIALAGFLIWKLKGPLRKSFEDKSRDIASTLERASNKSKEAQMMLDNEQRKSSNLANEIKTIQSQSQRDVMTYEQNLAKETAEKSQKMRADAQSKVQADRKAMLDELNTELLNQVIAKAKTTIKTNKEMQNKASSKLLQGLQ